MPIQEKCRIIDHQPIGPHCYKLTIVSPYISSHATPGQFINLKCADTFDPLLRRPLSIHRILKEHQQIELLYEVVGKGTELLSHHSVGQNIDVLGPLGQGFNPTNDQKLFLLVGGGMGVAPLLSLVEALKSSSLKSKAQVVVILGAKTKEKLYALKAYQDSADQVFLATEDGSAGEKGLVSDVLLGIINNQLNAYNLPLTTIYACGPKLMLRSIAEIAFQKQISCQLSMEQSMACGIGTCMGCVIKTKNGYKKVCDDGPVFDAKDILWD